MKIVWKYIEIVLVVVSFFFLIMSNLLSSDNNAIMGIDKLTADIVISILCYILIVTLNIKDTAGFSKKGFCKGLLLGSPFLLIGIASVIFSNAGVDLNNLKHISLGNTLLFTVNMIFVGVNEELWMRGLVLNALIRKYENSSIWKPICISALMFGLIHLPNIFFIAPLTLMVQVINAMCGGILFAAVFIRSKNIYSVIVIHALTDWIALFISMCFAGASSALSIEINIVQAIIMLIGGSLPPILISIYLLKDFGKDYDSGF